MDCHRINHYYDYTSYQRLQEREEGYQGIGFNFLKLTNPDTHTTDQILKKLRGITIFFKFDPIFDALLITNNRITNLAIIRN